MMKHLLVALVGVAPASRPKNSLLRKLGWSIGHDTAIGPGIYWRLDSVSVGACARIGPLNVFRDLADLELGERGRIGQWNWISASRPLRRAGGSGSLAIGADSALTARHYLDVSGGVRVGHHTTVAGVRSTFITHGIDWKRARQRTRGISIGNYCIVSSNVALAPGTHVSDCVVVGMGTTLSGEVGPSGALVTASRGSAVRTGLEGAYFSREIGYINKVEHAVD
ncbi:hypothetical protein GCM10017607_11330 [Microbacterium thalassium]|nr:hypothetical protein GCM10017607_11330 [Microbacterium thalassium]